MTDHLTKGESHGCIVCGKLYQLYVVTDASGKYVGAKVMSVGGRIVPNEVRPLVACESHSAGQVDAAVARVYGNPKKDEDDD